MSTRSNLIALASAVVLTACFQQHDPNAVETNQTDCYTCHKPEYEAAGRVSLGSVGCTTNPIPLHDMAAGGDKPTTCSMCHPSTVSWCPAANGIHPETEFQIASGRHAVPCLSCHSVAGLPYENGHNTSCIGCHMPDGSQPHELSRMDNKHQEEDAAEYQAARNDPNRDPNLPFTDENFCLVCHPRGKN